MTIEIRIEEQVNDKIFAIRHRITDVELDHASFDLPCHTIKKLREELERDKQEYIRSQERALNA